MDEMPVISVPIAAGVLAHRRDEHAICKLQISNRERIKQVSHKSYTTATDLDEPDPQTKRSYCDRKSDPNFGRLRRMRSEKSDSRWSSSLILPAEAFQLFHC